MEDLLKPINRKTYIISQIAVRVIALIITLIVIVTLNKGDITALKQGLVSDNTVFWNAIFGIILSVLDYKRIKDIVGEYGDNFNLLLFPLFVHLFVLLNIWAKFNFILIDILVLVYTIFLFYKKGKVA